MKESAVYHPVGEESGAGVTGAAHDWAGFDDVGTYGATSSWFEDDAVEGAGPEV